MIETAPGASARPVRPVVTAVVLVVTVVASVSALANAAVMRAMTRDVGELRHGQWWRIVSPILVQSSGWGQLVFNMSGLVVIGAALEQRLSRPIWIVVYLVGGVGSIALLTRWRPDDTGGGSSDAIAALIGALAVVFAVRGSTRRGDWPAQVYSIFFAGYLTGLALGGVVPSIIAGNLSVVAVFAVRRAWHPSSVDRACLVMIAACGTVMTVAHQGHGIGIVAGIAIASIVLAARPRSPCPRRGDR
jgi:membrane associated rhomboid family serine protease